MQLFDQFTAYMKEIKAAEQEQARFEAVFPCVLQVGPGARRGLLTGWRAGQGIRTGPLGGRGWFSGLTLGPRLGA